MQVGWSYVPSNSGKWVYYDQSGRMQYGQQYINSHWYLFDHYTGATTYSFAYIPDQTKWVFYDRVMGWMMYGQQCIDDGWYYLTPYTGAVDYDWAYLPDDQKWVYYDSVTGRMYHGAHWIEGRPRFFDPVTGRVWTAQEEINLLVSKAYASRGTNPDCPGELVAAHGSYCYEGPCMSYVWWCFHHPGLDMFLCDGAISGWPHDNYNWYLNRGRVDWSPRVGDIVFWRYPGWIDYDVPAPGNTASHAGIVVAVGPSSVTIIDALSNGIWDHPLNSYGLVGHAHPFWG